jgi:hypothetical protein
MLSGHEDTQKFGNGNTFSRKNSIFLFSLNINVYICFEIDKLLQNQGPKASKANPSHTYYEKKTLPRSGHRHIHVNSFRANRTLPQAFRLGASDLARWSHENSDGPQHQHAAAI